MLVAGVCVCTSATCVQQPVGLGTCLLNPRTLDSGLCSLIGKLRQGLM